MDETLDIDMTSDKLPFEEFSTSDPSNIKEFTKKVIQSWQEDFNKGSLSSIHFEELWRFCVPKIYCPNTNESCLNWNFNEDLAQDVLFNTLDDFICNGDSTTVLKMLSEMDKAPSVSRV